MSIEVVLIDDRRQADEDTDRPEHGARGTGLLASRRQRAVASYVAAMGPTDVRTLVTHVTALEYDSIVESTRLEWRQRVHVSLCRTHLPQLADEDIVDYDDALGTVRPGSRLGAVEPDDDGTRLVNPEQ